jgi:hemolysin activation/secretion protein
MILIVFASMSASSLAAEDTGDAGFEIRAFEVAGNSIFQLETLQNAVVSFTGSGKTASDVEKARDALEKLYHDAGYPAVMVNIPEQTLIDSVVKLQVIESRIGRLNISGNRYFTAEKIAKDLSSLAPGSMIYLPKVQAEIGRLNRNQDIKVEPFISPGKEPGIVDVEIKVEDHLPLHGYLELNNRASHDTSELRLNAMIRYDNLWQKGHSFSLQYQTAPQKLKEVQVAGGSYVLQSPWDAEHLIAVYGIWTDSETVFGEGFNIIGRGEIFGTRYVIPLLPYRLYNHNITLGVDYKHFNQAVGFKTESGQTTSTAISYLPFSISYTSSLPDEWGGETSFNGGLNFSFRGLISDESEFELKRYKGTANYLYATAGLQRSQKLPMEMGLLAKFDAQVSAQPLVDNEQYSSGGIESVRGYRESEAMGDNSLHCTLEVSVPDPFEKTGAGRLLQMKPVLFYDVAKMTIHEPLQGQNRSSKIEGTGIGVRGAIMKNVEYELDWAMALISTERTRSGDHRIYFKFKAII